MAKLRLQSFAQLIQYEITGGITGAMKNFRRTTKIGRQFSDSFFMKFSSIQKNLTIGANGAKLREWKSKMDIENAWLLNHVGWREHQNLAQSFKKLNPQIFERRNYTVVSSFKVVTRGCTQPVIRLFHAIVNLCKCEVASH